MPRTDSQYFQKSADRSLPFIERRIAIQYWEIQMAAEDMARSLENLAADAARKAEAFRALAEDPEGRSVPMMYTGMSSQVDRDAERFDTSVNALKVLTGVQNGMEREAQS